MPVKKGSTPRKGRSGGKAKPRADRAAIKNLVRDIPSLMRQDGYIAHEPPAAPKRPLTIEVNEAKRRWLWIGVAICTLFIFGFWIVNVRSMFFNAFGRPSLEKQIFQSTQQDFQALLNTLSINNAQLDRLKATIPNSANVTNTDANLANTSTTTDDALKAGLTELLFKKSETATSSPTSSAHFPIATSTNRP